MPLLKVLIFAEARDLVGGQSSILVDMKASHQSSIPSNDAGGTEEFKRSSAICGTVKDLMDSAIAQFPQLSKASFGCSTCTSKNDVSLLVMTFIPNVKRISRMYLIYLFCFRLQ